MLVVLQFSYIFFCSFFFSLYLARKVLVYNQGGLKGGGGHPLSGIRLKKGGQNVLKIRPLPRENPRSTPAYNISAQMPIFEPFGGQIVFV